MNLAGAKYICLVTVQIKSGIDVRIKQSRKESNYKNRLIMLQYPGGCSVFYQLKYRPLLKHLEQNCKPGPQEELRVNTIKNSYSQANDKKQKPVTRSSTGRENALPSLSSIDLILFIVDELSLGYVML